MIRTFSGFQGERADPWCYRIAFYGTDEREAWFVGVAFLSADLPADLGAHRARFRVRRFEPDELLSLDDGRVERGARRPRAGFPLAGLALHWTTSGAAVEAEYLLGAFARYKARGGSAPRPADPQATPAAVHASLPEGVQRIDVPALAGLVAGRNVLLLTGAGISTAAGFPGWSAFDQRLGFTGAWPVDGFVRELLTDPDSLVDRIVEIRRARPTPAHEAVRQHQDHLGIDVWTGNFDGLHQATGTKVRFLPSTAEPLDHGALRRFDALLAVGAPAALTAASPPPCPPSPA